MDNPDVLAKYQQFVNDFNSGLDRSLLCGKYNLAEDKFDSFLEFLRRKGYPLANPAQSPLPPTDLKPAGPIETAMADAEKKKSGMFAKIESREDAQKMVRDAAYAFYFTAALQGVIGYFILKSMIADGVLYAVLAFSLHKSSSRIAAVLLFLLTLISFVVTIMNKIGATNQGGGNIFLASIVLIISVRAIEATFKLRGKFKEAAPNPVTDGV
jgi:hypothetical protein